MKKNFTLSVLWVSLILFFPFQSISQGLSDNLDNQVAYRYDCEDDLIEVLFNAESQVRLRDGHLIDLATDALTGLDAVLNHLDWKTWSPICDVPESEMDQWAANGRCL